MERQAKSTNSPRGKLDCSMLARGGDVAVHLVHAGTVNSQSTAHVVLYLFTPRNSRIGATTACLPCNPANTSAEVEACKLPAWQRPWMGRASLVYINGTGDDNPPPLTFAGGEIGCRSSRQIKYRYIQYLHRRCWKLEMVEQDIGHLWPEQSVVAAAASSTFSTRR